MVRVELLVDAANVIGSRPDGWWRDRPGAAARLLSTLAAALRSGALTGPVVVVLEGAARAGAPVGEFPVAAGAASSATGASATGASATGTPAGSDADGPPAETAAGSATGSAADAQPANPATGPAADAQPANPATGPAADGQPANPATGPAVDGPRGGVASDGPVLRVVHASRDGDSAIVDEVTALVAAGGSPRVVTADRGLRDRVLAVGGTVVGLSWLLDRL
jgi:hypothetical protein